MLSEEIKKIEMIVEEAESNLEAKMDKKPEIKMEATDQVDYEELFLFSLNRSDGEITDDTEDDTEDEEKENGGYSEIRLNVGEAGTHGGPLALRFPSNRTGLNLERVHQVLSGDESLRLQVFNASVAYLTNDHNNELLESFRSAGLLALFEDLYDERHIVAAFN